MSEKSSLTKKDSASALSAITESISEALKKGEKVVIPSFGTFEITTRKERQGRNPQTGETVTIPASRNVHFKAGKGLKAQVQ